MLDAMMNDAIGEIDARREREAAPVAPIPATQGATGASGLPASAFSPVMLPVHGRRPMRFNGAQILAANDWRAGDDSPLWFDITVWETDAGELVVQHCLRFRSQDLLDVSHVHVCEEPAQVLDFLLSWDAAPDMPADLPGEGAGAAALADALTQHQQMIAAVTARWKALLRRLFPAEFSNHS